MEINTINLIEVLHKLQRFEPSITVDWNKNPVIVFEKLDENIYLNSPNWYKRVEELSNRANGKTTKRLVNLFNETLSSNTRNFFWISNSRIVARTMISNFEKLLKAVNIEYVLTKECLNFRRAKDDEIVIICFMGIQQFNESDFKGMEGIMTVMLDIDDTEIYNKVNFDNAYNITDKIRFL